MEKNGQKLNSKSTKNPFTLFPIEVWEGICNEVKDSKDVVSVLRGVPQLDISVNQRKKYWLIGQILPLLYGKIKEKDVKTLRLACKQWQVKVDSFLENQPGYRAFSQELDRDNLNFWDYLNYDLDGTHFQMCLHLSSSQTKGSKFREIMEHPPTRNPFLCREILFSFEADEQQKLEQFMDRTFDLLDRFGAHLFYLHIQCQFSLKHDDVINLPNGIHQTVVKIMQKTPNLKSLTLNANSDWGCCGASGRHKHSKPVTHPPVLETDLPELPSLETFSIIHETELFSEQFVSLFLKRYGSQLRRLEMPMERWKVEELNETFPKLTELEIAAYEKVHRKLPHIKNLLSSISAPNLASITLSLDHSKLLNISVEDDILKWLKRFPCVKYFNLSSLYQYGTLIELEEKGTADPSKDLVPSLETFKIMDSYGLSYNFLRCFPALRILELSYQNKPLVVDFSTPTQSIKLREQIQTGKVYESNVWELLPKLRKVFLLPYDVDAGEPLIFNRDSYEKLKRARKFSQEPALHPFREGIRDFLEDPQSDYEFEWSDSENGDDDHDQGGSDENSGQASSSSDNDSVDNDEDDENLSEEEESGNDGDDDDIDD